MYRFLLALLFVLAGLLPRATQASHVSGGDITYESLGNNRYRVTCRYLIDCSVLDGNGPPILNCRVGSPASSCATTDARNFSVTMTRSSSVLGTPYCASIPGGSVCLPLGQYINFEQLKFTADVTLPPAPEWTLSVEMAARPILTNISGNTTLRLEATLHTQLTLPDGSQQVVANSSPQPHDQDPGVPFALVSQRHTVTFFSHEPDGDSVVYSLERPLEGCNQFATYLPVPQPSPPTSTCLIVLAPAATQFSPTFPLLSLALTGNCPVLTGTPDFGFNPRFGQMRFTPVQYLPGPVALGYNRYVVTGQATEYRKIGATYYKIGSVRREMTILVVDGATNRTPNRPTFTNGPTTYSLDTLVVTAPAGLYQELDYHFSDPDAGQQLTVSVGQPAGTAYPDLHVNPVAPGAPLTVLNNGTATPTLHLRLRPDPYLAGRTLSLPVKVEDNGCPVKGTQYYVVRIRVTPSRPTATKAAAQREQLTAYPTPFTDEAHFTLPRPASPAGPVLILDQLGRVVDRLPAPATTNVTEATFTWRPAATVPAGIYSARFADGQYTVRLVRAQH